MRKQKTKRNALKKQKRLIMPVGVMITELVLWDFSGNEELVRHNANELAKAIVMHYNLQNFGPANFGLSEDSEE
jgi:hypothetical protein